ncbi:MAG: metallophosphoesterase [Prosthecobacter sp.]|nr:metallophosphoesterase [Prosthecobacter sp.]
MPLHLTPGSTRRHFLGHLGAAVTLSCRGEIFAAADAGEELIAILNDTHIGAQQKADSNIPRHLRETVDWLLKLGKRPAAVVINGDLALRDGQAGDYTNFVKLIAPLRDAGIPIHLTMGNHDNREVFYRVLAAEKPQQPAVAARHVSVVKLAKANLFLLDSLKQTMIAPGDLGAEQLSWLGKMLDAHADKPALIVAHHNPRLGGDPVHFPGGLEDSEALWQVLAARPQVKAYVHGHIHHLNYFGHQGIHILNTPATSYVADPKTSTTGWTMAKLSDTGGIFMTHTHLPDHAWNGAVKQLTWRS